MDVQHVTTHARERLGMEVQAASLLGAQPAGRPCLEVWSLMTEHGWFWLVEGGSEVELFHASPVGARSVRAAVRQFLELHPQERPAQRRSPPVAPTPSAYDCRGCGVWVSPRRRSAMIDRQLCRRCHHAEQQAERYRNDPAYRAHLFVTRRASYRAARRRGEP